jgi:hypothetical protein
MDVGKGREHDCRDAGGRAMQEQLPRSGSFQATENQALIKFILYFALAKLNKYLSVCL